MSFLSVVAVQNVSTSLSNLDFSSQQSIVDAIDVTIGAPAGSTQFLSAVINNNILPSFNEKTRLLVSVVEAFKVTVLTQVYLASFPQYVNDPQDLYRIFANKISSAVKSGNFTKILRRMSVRDKSASTTFAVCSNVTVNSPAFTESSSGPANSNSGSNSGTTLTGGELSIAIAVVVIGVVLLGIVVYAVARYFTRQSAKYKQAMEITAASLDEVPYSYPTLSQEYFSQNDVDLDKLNYIADISETKV